MELFLLIAIGITIISFISIALTQPSPTITEELIPEPAQAELISEEEAQARILKIKKEGASLEAEEQELLEEEIPATMS
jgi:hypothetical protein